MGKGKRGVKSHCGARDEWLYYRAFFHQRFVFHRFVEPIKEMEVSISDGAECHQVTAASFSSHPTPSQSRLKEPPADHTWPISPGRGMSKWIQPHVLTNHISYYC